MSRKPLHKPFLDAAIKQRTDQCIEWPFSKTKDGYGTTASLGKGTTAHRAVAVMAHGAPLTENMDAAHLCHNRSCVNPRHIVWATRSENLAQSSDAGRLVCASQQGQNNHKSKLTDAEVLQILNLRTRMTQRQIANEFGVHHATISKILSGKKWLSVTQIDRRVGCGVNTQK
jgi:hypothetical protein